MTTAFSLAHLTVLHLSPPEVVWVAAMLGYHLSDELVEVVVLVEELFALGQDHTA